MYYIVNCVNCKKGHRKCDRKYPQCSLCLQKGIECEYKPPKKRLRKDGEVANAEQFLVDESVLQETESLSTSSSTNVQQPQQQNQESPSTIFISAPSPLNSSVEVSLNSIDMKVIGWYMNEFCKIDPRFSLVAKLISQSIEFFKQPNIEVVSAKERLTHFAFLNSIVGITLLIQEQYDSVDYYFDSTLKAIMSNIDVYLDTPNSLLLAWVWLNLTAMSCLDRTKVDQMRLFTNNIKAFVDSSRRKVKAAQQKFRALIQELQELQSHLQLIENYLKSFFLMTLETDDIEYSATSVRTLVNYLFEAFCFDQTVLPNAEVLVEQTALLLECIAEIEQGQYIHEIQANRVMIQFSKFIETERVILGASVSYPDAIVFSLVLGSIGLKLRFLDEMITRLTSSCPFYGKLLELKIQVANEITQYIHSHQELWMKKRMEYIVRRHILDATKIHMSFFETRMDDSIEFCKKDLFFLSKIVQSKYSTEEAAQAFEKLKLFLEQVTQVNPVEELQQNLEQSYNQMLYRADDNVLRYFLEMQQQQQQQHQQQLPPQHYHPQQPRNTTVLFSDPTFFLQTNTNRTAPFAMVFNNLPTNMPLLPSSASWPSPSNSLSNLSPTSVDSVTSHHIESNPSFSLQDLS